MYSLFFRVISNTLIFAFLSMSLVMYVYIFHINFWIGSLDWQATQLTVNLVSGVGELWPVAADLICVCPRNILAQWLVNMLRANFYWFIYSVTPFYRNNSLTIPPCVPNNSVLQNTNILLFGKCSFLFCLNLWLARDFWILPSLRVKCCHTSSVICIDTCIPVESVH